VSDEFYLQDGRDHAYVGDGLSFWGFGGSGYVTDLDKAQLFTKSGACDHRDTDIPWPKAYVDARARVGVDHQCVTLVEAFEQHPDAPEFYLQKPKVWNGNNLIWLDDNGRTSSDLRSAVKVPASLVAKTSATLGHHGAVAWPCAYIDAHSRRLVERDDVNIKEALRGTGIKLRKPEKLKQYRNTYRCDLGCGRFLKETDFYGTCPGCGANNY